MRLLKHNTNRSFLKNCLHRYVISIAPGKNSTFCQLSFQNAQLDFKPTLHKSIAHFKKMVDFKKGFYKVAHFSGRAHSYFKKLFVAFKRTLKKLTNTLQKKANFAKQLTLREECFCKIDHCGKKIYQNELLFWSVLFCKILFLEMC